MLVGPQNPFTNFTKNFLAASENAKGSMDAVIITAILFNLLGSSAMHAIRLMTQSLSLIVHLPIFRVSVPGNVVLFNEVAIKISMFDYMETFWKWEDHQEILSFAEPQLSEDL